MQPVLHTEIVVVENGGFQACFQANETVLLREGERLLSGEINTSHSCLILQAGMIKQTLIEKMIKDCECKQQPARAAFCVSTKRQNSKLNENNVTLLSSKLHQLN